MKKICLVALLLLCVSVACKKKDDNRQYSYWYVNNDSFKTNDVRSDQGHAIAEITGNNFQNYFALQFNLSYFPTSDSFFLNCSQQNPKWVCFGLTYNGVGYSSPQNAFLKATSINGNPQYILMPTWFYNESNKSDSVLIHGIFNKP